MKQRSVMALCMTVGWFLAVVLPARAADTVTVGSKNFTEQEILAEIVAQLLEAHTDLEVDRQTGLGGTGVCHSALLAGELDIYVEYTGTALLDVLRQPTVNDPGEVFRRVWRVYHGKFDLEWLPPIGFNNTYVLAVRGEAADEQGWSCISDLVPQADDLRGGFTSEFVERPDGYPGLADIYGFELGKVIDLDPGLMYQALADGQVDVISAFATDSRIITYGLRTLEDDRRFFPPYDAAPVVRGDLLRRYPEIRAVLAPLAGAVDDAGMRRLNHQVDNLRRRPAEVARAWLASRGMNVRAPASRPAASSTKVSIWQFLNRRRGELGRKTIEHLILTGAAMFVAVLVGLPLGILIHRWQRFSSLVLSLTEIVQTIPSLAMLAFLFALYRTLGIWPAVTALVMYALLPIVLNTYTGLREVPARITEAADGVGMSRRQRMWMVELPLALPVIVAGIRTATVWTVGIATLSTYIGAGGLGDFISRGLSRVDPRLTLLGAVPAAVMAVVFSLLIRAIERRLSRT